jgi:hypothetical protein
MNTAENRLLIPAEYGQSHQVGRWSHQQLWKGVYAVLQGQVSLCAQPQWRWLRKVRPSYGFDCVTSMGSRKDAWEWLMRYFQMFSAQERLPAIRLDAPPHLAKSR